jgi:SAM-dependent methyltransferase
LRRRGAGARLLATALPLTTMSGRVPVPPLQALEDDTSLEHANQIFWSSLLKHVQAEVSAPVESILDVGCHHGGLLVRLASALHPRSITGVEPSTICRERALFRLRTLAPSVAVLSPERWGEVPTASVNLIICHEVLHLVEDLPGLFHQISRTLRVQGTAYVVAGCHTENPVWPRWSAQLRAAGQTVMDRSPFDILRAGIGAGLSGALRPLRRDGWIIYDPDHAAFQYSSAEELLDHQYRHKLLFRFVKQP